MSNVLKTSRSRMALFTCTMLACVSGAQDLRASSPEAWEEFQNDVRDTCIAASQGIMQVMRVEVDPEGSESYGFAVLFGFQSGDPRQRLLVCAYNKREQTAEISTLFDA